MKKVAFLILFLGLSLASFSQTIWTIDISEISGTDSTYWFTFRTKRSSAIPLDFTALSGSTATVSVFYGVEQADGSVKPLSINEISDASPVFPLTLDKASYQEIWTDENGTDTVNQVGVHVPDWNYKKIGFEITPNGLTGTLRILPSN